MATKNKPILKNKFTPIFGMELLQRVHAFRSRKYAHLLHVVLLSKKHQRSSTMQEKGLTNEGSPHLLLLQGMHNNSNIAESLHALHG